MNIEDRLIAAGVRNLKEYGYPGVTAENICTDYVFKAFFVAMLNDNLGQGDEVVDHAIRNLIKRCEA